MREPLITLKDTRHLLLPNGRIQDLVRAVRKAHALWLSDYAEHHAVLDNTARSRIYYCHFYRFAHDALDQQSGILFGDDQQQKFVAFDDRASLRFKHFGKQLQTKNYPTKHSKEWVKQIPLDTIPPFARLELGYRLDLLGLEIRDIFVTHPNGVNGVFNDWIWQVYGAPVNDTFGQQKPFGQRVDDDDMYWHDNLAI